MTYQVYPFNPCTAQGLDADMQCRISLPTRRRVAS